MTAIPALWLLTADRDDVAVVARGFAAICDACGPHRVALVVRLSARPVRQALALLNGVREARPDARVVVSRRLDLARACGVWGAHLPASAVATDLAREYLGPGVLLVRTAHDDARELAAAATADVVVLSPVWPARSHVSGHAPMGPARAAELARQLRRPALALGGVTPSRAADAARLGITAVAVASGVWDAADPVAAASALLSVRPHPQGDEV